jgi:HNH endonuclease
VSANPSVAERFWSKVDKSGDCWPWTAGLLKDGYGQFRRNGTSVVASRMAWELTYGTIPSGLHVCHKCDNPPCCNPTHLFLGTPRDNRRDCAAKGRVTAWKAVVTKADTLVIRAAYAAGGITQAELGRQFGISQTAVSRIVLQKTWCH